MKNHSYTCAAAAARLDVSAAYFSRMWRQWVDEGKLPRPSLFNPARPRFPAAMIDRIAAGGSWDAAPKPARPEPLALEGDPELARRALEV